MAGHLTSIYTAALTWLSQGRALVPLQPGSKHLVGGFGAYQRKITEEGEAGQWFRDRSCNLAVVLGDGLVCLDFDLVADYEAWKASWGALAASYTEKSRRGYHVFLAGDSQSGTAPGYEILAGGKVVTVASSCVDGFEYEVVNPGASISHSPDGFFLLSESSKSVGSVLPTSSGDVIARVKATWRVEDVAREGGIWLRESGNVADRWLVGKCPFHDDRHPSFWVDVERGLWGCRACHIRGDVINLYARLNNLSVSEAIKQMAAKL